MFLEFKDIQKAHRAIKDSIIRTPTVHAARLSLHTGVELYFKLENLQHTNAFKARGALNKLLTLDAEQRRRGVIACSAGNHAQGVAYHAQKLGIPATIVMPENTPFNKIQKTQDFGANVILLGANFDESSKETVRLAEEKNFVFVHPYDDKDIAAGQGTVGLEMMEQRPDLDIVIVPIGGGGLMAGVSTAIKAMQPHIEIIGVQAENYAAVKGAIEEYKAETGGPTLAEGIAVKNPSAQTIEVIRQNVSRIEIADESEIEKAVFDLISDEKLVVEGCSAAALAIVNRNREAFRGKKVGIVISGGNIDSRMLSTLILRGLVRDGRITRLRFEIDDTPGQLSDIARIIGESRANVIEVIHQRMLQAVPLKRAELDVVIEAQDRPHVEKIMQTLSDAGFKVRNESDV